MEVMDLERVEIKEQDLNNVVGGSFNYIERGGQTICVVDGIGAYYASANAFGKISAYASDVTLTAQEVVDWALANGYLSKTPY